MVFRLMFRTVVAPGPAEPDETLRLMPCPRHTIVAAATRSTPRTARMTIRVLDIRRKGYGTTKPNESPLIA